MTGPGYQLTIDAVWCDCECADCARPIETGQMIGMRPVSRNASLTICSACVTKEVEVRRERVRRALVLAAETGTKFGDVIHTVYTVLMGKPDLTDDEAFALVAGIGVKTS